jgi:putative transposase
LSVRRQCELLSLPRSSYYFTPQPESPENLELMKLIDQIHLERPFFGSRQMTTFLQRAGHTVNRKRIRRLMSLMRIEAVYPRPRTTRPDTAHKVYPYLLRDVKIERVNQVWSSDITYVPMRNGFLYLVAVIDWYSRYVLSWKLSNTLDGLFCLECLEESLTKGTPEIFNTDQGAQFTASRYTGCLEAAGIRVSMDGKGRALDNVWVERLWRSVKYEECYLKDYESGEELYHSLKAYFDFYHRLRPHQGLNNQTPEEVYKTG